jgi:hypothetical protein
MIAVVAAIIPAGAAIVTAVIAAIIAPVTAVIASVFTPIAAIVTTIIASVTSGVATVIAIFPSLGGSLAWQSQGGRERSSGKGRQGQAFHTRSPSCFP